MNLCACRNRNRGPEWATDGTGSREVVCADGSVMHRECLDSLMSFAAEYLADSSGNPAVSGDR